MIFGASGDLAKNKLFPSMYRLWSKGVVFNYYAVARTEMEEKDFQMMVEKATGDKEFSQKWHFVSGNYDYQGLGKLKIKGESIFYLALPTRMEVIKPLIEGLVQRGLLGKDSSRVVLEKPFGTDYDSAKEMMDFLEKKLDKDRVYLVDHYLTKELVRNLISLRFANPIWEKLWNQEFIKEINIIVVEKRGVEGRGGYYDKTGEIRDMIQNHGLQLLALTIMDCPKNLRYEDFIEKKLEVFKQLRLYSSVEKSVKIGQYDGYQKVEGVKKNSDTETLAEVKFRRNAAAWKNIPLTIVSGKKMTKKLTEINIVFKNRETCLWGIDSKKFTPNQLTIRLAPNKNIYLTMNSSFEPDKSNPKPVKLRLGSLAKSDPYDKVILDVIDENRLNMPSFDEILAQWKIVDAILAEKKLRKNLFCY